MLIFPDKEEITKEGDRGSFVVFERADYRES